MLFILSIISFLSIHLEPNSFFASGELNPNISQEALKNLQKIYGLDRPLIIQYFSWAKAILSLNFGISFVSGEMVRTEILEKLPTTLLINISSMILIFAFSLYFGIKSALKKDKLQAKIINQISLLSFSMPIFYLSLILLMIFSVKLKILPLSGLHSGLGLSGFAYYFDTFKHLILPVFVLTFSGIGSLSLYIRSLCLDILKSDYVFFARARGLGTKTIIRHFILPNLYPPLVTMLGLSLPALIGGSVVIESIFSINAMGFLFYQSVLSHDYPVIMGILMVGAFLSLLGNILADITLLYLNPTHKENK